MLNHSHESVPQVTKFLMLPSCHVRIDASIPDCETDFKLLKTKKSNQTLQNPSQNEVANSVMGQRLSVSRGQSVTLCFLVVLAGRYVYEVYLLKLYIIFAFIFFLPRITDENKLRNLTTMSAFANLLIRA